MRLGFLTAGVFLSALMMPAMADGCGGACDFEKPQAVVAPKPVHHAVRHVRPRLAGNYYNYRASVAVREGYGHGAWQVAPNDGQVPMMGPVIEAMPGPCCAPAPLPQPMCDCAPMAYGPPPQAYGPPPGYYGPPPGYYASAYPYTHIDDKGWTGGVGYNADGGGGGGGGFTDGYGQVHFANGGGQQNGPTYNDYNQSFQTNPTGFPGAFVPQRMGGAAPVSTSSSSSK